MVKKAALIFGSILLLIGILGFFPAFTTEVAGEDHERLLGIFAIDTVHNIVHILTGVVAIASAGTVMAARRFFQIFGMVYAAVLVIGLIQGDTVLGLFHVNGADHVLHFVIAAFSLYMGFGTQERSGDPVAADTDAS